MHKYKQPYGEVNTKTTCFAYFSSVHNSHTNHTNHIQNTRHSTTSNVDFTAFNNSVIVPDTATNTCGGQFSNISHSHHHNSAQGTRRGVALRRPPFNPYPAPPPSPPPSPSGGPYPTPPPSPPHSSRVKATVKGAERIGTKGRAAFPKSLGHSAAALCKSLAKSLARPTACPAGSSRREAYNIARPLRGEKSLLPARMIAEATKSPLHMPFGLP